MAKSNGKVRLITGILAIAAIFAGLVGTWTVYGKDIKSNRVDIAALEIDGCKPSDKNKFDIALIQKDIVAIQESQAGMRTEQKEGFRAILERLPK